MDDIVISGLAGRFPEGDNIQKFAERLYAGERKDQPADAPLDASRFDAPFFGVDDEEADGMLPQARMLLELTHEALVDAGFNPGELRGSCTGVFISGPSDYGVPGHLSSWLDLKGPSLDAPSPLAALQKAVQAVRDGQCDGAVVGACALRDLRSSGEGGSGNGVPDAVAAASEAVGVFLLQRARVARRAYATVVHAGATAEAASVQDGLRRAYREAGVDPGHVTYVEAHGVAGHKDIDALAEVLCTNRSVALPIALLPESDSYAVRAVAKVLLAMERGQLPGAAWAAPRCPGGVAERVAALRDGGRPLQTTDDGKVVAWGGGLAAVHAVGCGQHLLLRSNPEATLAAQPAAEDGTSVLVVASGRTKQAVRHMLDQAAELHDYEALALLADVHRQAMAGHPFRGYAVVGSGPRDPSDPRGGPADAVSEVARAGKVGRPIWWVFSGLGAQWPQMAKSMMRLEPFARAIQKCAAALEPHKVDLVDFLVNGTEADMRDVVNTHTAIVAVQVALVDVLRALGVRPDGIVGHSTGEIACGYADGSLTAEEAVLVAHWEAHSVAEARMPPGAMATVALTWDEVKARVPADVVPACDNAVDSVSVSGPPASVAAFVKSLDGGASYELDSCGLACHSPYMAGALPKLRERLEALLPDPKPRSPVWVSTSVREEDRDAPWTRLNGADYHVNSVASPVRFVDGLRHIPKNAIVIEVAPHCAMRPMIKRGCGPGISLLSLMVRDIPNNLRFMLSAIGKAFVEGAQPQVRHLLPAVQYPVSRGTPMLAPLVRWDHSVEWAAPDDLTPAL